MSNHTVTLMSFALDGMVLEITVPKGSPAEVHIDSVDTKAAASKLLVEVVSMIENQIFFEAMGSEDAQQQAELNASRLGLQNLQKVRVRRCKK